MKRTLLDLYVLGEIGRYVMVGEASTNEDEDTIPMARSEIDAAIAAHEAGLEWPEPEQTRSPPCDACADRALRLDENDELPEARCSWCAGSGSMTPSERRAYLESLR